VGFVTLIYQSVTYPLNQLMEGTRKIAQGEWNLKLDLSGPQELRDLAQSFEKMGKSLGDLQSQVLQMDRMSAVGTLAGGVAHEINNPLTGVLGQAQLLLSTLPSDDPRRPNLEKIERAAKRCKKIVRGLLDFSRPQDYSFQPIDVESVLESVLSLCETEIEAIGVRVVWQRNASLPKAWASENHLQQVFLNILTNAMHAMPRGGSLTIRAEETGPYRLPETAPEGEPAVRKYVQIHFSDTGVGISSENIPRVFDPFFTTKDPGKGTGLGLSISYGIMSKHRGAIEVSSEGVGRGATFTVRIPVSPLPFDLEPPTLARADEGEGAMAGPLEF
jgi:two-component system NtrC family sensor kinase